MLDVFFISMGEEGSEANWRRLLEFVPDAKRVENIVGIYNVHKACAVRSSTKNFWVVDADAWIVDNFDFSWEPDATAVHWGVPENECVVIWPSINPVNDLVYGYGAVKVFPRTPFINNNKWAIDMSTSLSDVVISKDVVSCETRFNATPESAWVGAFRESAKLASLAVVKIRIRKSIAKQKAELDALAEFVDAQDLPSDKKTNYRNVQTIIINDRFKIETDIFSYWDEIETCSHRRLIWCTFCWNKPNGKYSVLGARAGAAFGLKHGDDLLTLNHLNNWAWLKKEFKKCQCLM